MKKSLALLFLLAFNVSVFSQSVYIPAGTSGIGNNTTNSNIGIGTSTPSDQVEIITGTRKVGFNGSIPGGSSVGGLITLSTATGGKNFFMGYAPYNGTYQDPVIANLTDYSEMRFVSGTGTATLSHGFGFYVSQGPANNYGFSPTRSTPVVKISEVGLGIGTVSPNTKLDVAGLGGNNVDIRATGQIQTGDGNYKGGLWVNYQKTMMFGASSANALGIYNQGDWRLVVNNAGNVGIGVPNAVSRLQVGGTGGTTVDMRVNGRIMTGDAALTGGVYVNWTGTQMLGQVDANTMGLYNNAWRLVVANNGTVGIGTSTPTSRLDIVGNGGSASDVKVNGRIQSGDTGNLGGLVVGTGTSMMFGQQSSNSLGLYNNGAWRLIVDNAGNVGIGTTAPDAPLAVKGRIHAKEVKVDVTGALAPDYVFTKDYTLPSLEKVEQYVNKNHHLPEVPSAKEMEANGVDLGEMNLLLLKKIEELTLYVIELKKEVNELKSK